MTQPPDGKINARESSVLLTPEFSELGTHGVPSEYLLSE